MRQLANKMFGDHFITTPTETVTRDVWCYRRDEKFSFLFFRQ